MSQGNAPVGGQPIYNAPSTVDNTIHIAVTKRPLSGASTTPRSNLANRVNVVNVSNSSMHLDDALLERAHREGERVEEFGAPSSIRPTEARERAEKLRYKQISLCHDSLLIQPHGDSWLSTYLSRLTEEHSPSLVALLDFLNRMNLPKALRQDILLDLLANGEESVSAEHLRPAMFRFYEVIIKNKLHVINRQPKDQSPSPVATNGSASLREVEEALNLHALAKALGVSSTAYQMSGWWLYLRVSEREEEKHFFLGRVFEEFTLTWDNVAQSVSRNFHALGYKDIHAASSLLTAIDEPRSSALPAFSEDNRTWLEQIMEFCEEEREELNTLLVELAELYRADKQNLTMETFLSSIYEAQEFVTPRRLLEFFATVREYNIEWAVASFQWLRNGEESQVLATLDRVLDDSPWSDHRHGGR